MQFKIFTFILLVLLGVSNVVVNDVLRNIEKSAEEKYEESSKKLTEIEAFTKVSVKLISDCVEKSSNPEIKAILIKYGANL